MCWNCKSLNSKIQWFWFWNGTLRWVHIGWCKFLWKSLWQAKLLVPFLLGNELGDSRAIARAWVWGSNISSDDLDKFESVEGTYSESENCGKDVQFMVLPAWRLLREAVLPKGISQGGADRQQEGSDLLWHPHFFGAPSTTAGRLAAWMKTWQAIWGARILPSFLGKRRKTGKSWKPISAFHERPKVPAVRSCHPLAWLKRWSVAGHFWMLPVGLFSFMISDEIVCSGWHRGKPDLDGHSAEQSALRLSLPTTRWTRLFTASWRRGVGRCEIALTIEICWQVCRSLGWMNLGRWIKVDKWTRTARGCEHESCILLPSAFETRNGWKTGAWNKGRSSVSWGSKLRFGGQALEGWEHEFIFLTWG